MEKISLSSVVVGILLSVVVLCGACKGRGNVLVSVGGQKIRESDLDLLTRVNPRLKARLATPAGKQKILENFVEQELLYQESTHRGVQRKEAVKEKLELYEKIIVAQALVDDELDRKVREYYDTHRDEFERVKVAHLLIRTVAEETPGPAAKKGKKPAGPALKRSDEAALKLAQSVHDRLAKGESFDKLAKDLSEDDRTKKNGGDLGYITIRDKRLERWEWLPLAEKAFAMKKDEVSDPIKTKDGYHLVKVAEEKQLQPFEEAEGSIRFRIQADIRTALLEDLKKKYKVKYAEAEKSPAMPMVPPESAPPETAPAAPPAAAAAETAPSAPPQTP